MIIYSLDVLFFPIWNQSIVPYLVLTVASWPAYRFLRRRVRWFGVPISLRIFHSLLESIQSKVNIVSEAEVDVSLEFSCFFCDPMDVGDLISGSSDFSKSNLNIKKLSVHVLLKPNLENFENYFASMWEEWNCAIAGAFFGIAFLWDGMKTDLFQSCGHCWVFQIGWHIECSTLTASSFRIWNSSAGIPSLSLALFVAMLPKTHLTSPPRWLALGEWSHHCGYLGHEDLFCLVLLCILSTSS